MKIFVNRKTKFVFWGFSLFILIACFILYVSELNGRSNYEKDKNILLQQKVDDMEILTNSLEYEVKTFKEEIEFLKNENTNLKSEISNKEQLITEHKETISKLNIKENQIVIDSNIDLNIISLVLDYYEAIEEEDAEKFLSTTWVKDPNDSMEWRYRNDPEWSSRVKSRDYSISKITIYHKPNESFIGMHICFHLSDRVSSLVAMRRNGVWKLVEDS